MVRRERTQNRAGNRIAADLRARERWDAESCAGRRVYSGAETQAANAARLKEASESGRPARIDAQGMPNGAGRKPATGLQPERQPKKPGSRPHDEKERSQMRGWAIRSEIDA